MLRFLMMLALMGALFLVSECCRLIHHLASVAFNVKSLSLQFQCEVS